MPSSSFFRSRRSPTAELTPQEQVITQEQQAVNQANADAEYQDLIKKDQREQKQKLDAIESEQKKAATAQKAKVAAMKRAGVATETDASGNETVKTHDDGSPLYKADFLGRPAVDDAGKASATYRDTRNQRFNIPLDAINRTTDAAGQSFYEFDVNGQRIRRPESPTNPLFKVDPTTGRRYSEAQDAETGNYVQQPLGIDPRAASKAAITRKAAEYDKQKQARTFESQNLDMERTSAATNFEPVRERFTAAKSAAKKFTTGKRYEQGPDGLYSIDRINGEDFRNAINSNDTTEIAKANAWLASKKTADDALAAARAEHDPAKQRLHDLEVKRNTLAEQALRASQAHQTEVADMEEASKAGLSLAQPGWKTVLDEMRKNPRYQQIVAAGEYADHGSDLAGAINSAITAINRRAPNYVEAKQEPPLSVAQKVLRDLNTKAPRENYVDPNAPPDAKEIEKRNFVQTIADGITTGKPQADAHDIKNAQAIAAKSLNVADPEKWSLTPGQMGDFDLHHADSDEPVGRLDPDNNRILLFPNATLGEAGRAMMSKASADGMPVYRMGGAQPMTPQELRDYVAGAVESSRMARTETEKEAALAQAGVTPDDIRDKMMSGRISVQDAKWLNQKLFGASEHDNSREGYLRGFQDWLGQNPTAKEMLAKGTPAQKGAVIDQFATARAGQSQSDTTLDRDQLTERRFELQQQFNPQSTLTKAGNVVKEALVPMAGMLTQAVAYVPMKVAQKLGVEADAIRLSDMQGADWWNNFGSFTRKMNARPEVESNVDELRQWAVRARPGDQPPQELADKLAKAIYEGYHAYTPEQAKDRDTSEDSFNVNKDPMLKAALQSYLATSDAGALQTLMQLMVTDRKARNTQAELSKYIERPRVATAAEVLDRAAPLGIKLNEGSAGALLSLSKSLETAKDAKQAEAILAQAGKILGTKTSDDTALAFHALTTQATTDPNSMTGMFRSGFSAGPQEMATEVASSALETMVAMGTGGAATPEILAERAARTGARAALRRTFSRVAARTLDAITEDSALLTAARRGIASGRAKLGGALAKAEEDFAKAGLVTPKFGQPLTFAQKARNVAVQAAKTGIAAAPTEGAEEAAGYLGENDPTMSGLAEQAAMGALGGVIVGPSFLPLAYGSNVLQTRKANAAVEAQKAKWADNFNKQMAGVPGFKPMTPADFDVWAGLTNNPTHQAAVAEYEDALSEMNDTLNAHDASTGGVVDAINKRLAELEAQHGPLQKLAPDSTPENPRFEPYRIATVEENQLMAQRDALLAKGPQSPVNTRAAIMAAQARLDAAKQNLVGLSESAFMAADELRQIPEADRPLYTGVAKAVSGAREFTEAEATALVKLEGNNKVAFQQAETLPADVEGPRNLKTLADLPDVTPTAPKRYALPEGVNVAVPDAAVALLAEKAPQTAALLGHQQAVAPVATNTPAATAVATNAPSTTPATTPPATKAKGAKAKPVVQTPTTGQQTPLVPAVADIPNAPMPAKAAAVEYAVNQKIIDTGKHPNGKKATREYIEGLKQRQVQVAQNFANAMQDAGPAQTPNKPAPSSKAAEAIARRVIGETLAKSKKLKAIISESKRGAGYPTGGMWMRADGTVAFHMPTLTAQLEGLDDQTAAQRVAALLDEEVRHAANIEAARRLWKRGGTNPMNLKFEDWRDAWYADIWDNHFTPEMRAKVEEAYGETIPEAKWQKAMEGLRMLDQLRATGSITEAILRHLEAVLQALREFLDTASPKIKQEIEAIKTVLQEFGYEGGTGKVNEKKAKKQARKPEAKTDQSQGVPVNTEGSYSSEGGATPPPATNSTEDTPKSSTQLTLKPEDAAPIISFAKTIPDSELADNVPGDAGNAREDEPQEAAAKPKSGASAAAIAKAKRLKDKFGLASAPAPSVYTTGLPREKEARDAFSDLAEMLIDDSVTEPTKLALFLDEVSPDGSMRKYADAMWSTLRSVDPSLPRDADWSAIYAAIDNMPGDNDPKTPNPNSEEPKETDPASKKSKRKRLGKNPLERYDLLDHLAENKIAVPPADQRKGRGEYDWLNDISPYYRSLITVRVSDTRNTNTPDVAAQTAYDDGLIPEPTADALGRAVAETIAKRQQMRATIKRAERMDKSAAEQRDRFNQDKSDGGKPINIDAIYTGDSIILNGETLEVLNVEYDEDGYTTSIKLRDGTKYGVQQVDRGDVLLVDEFIPRTRTAPADDFALDTESEDEIRAREEAERQKAKIREKQNAPLAGTAGEFGTPDMLDSTAGAMALFNQPLAKPPEPASVPHDLSGGTDLERDKPDAGLADGSRGRSVQSGSGSTREDGGRVDEAGEGRGDAAIRGVIPADVPAALGGSTGDPVIRGSEAGTQPGTARDSGREGSRDADESGVAVIGAGYESSGEALNVPAGTQPLAQGGQAGGGSVSGYPTALTPDQVGDVVFIENRLAEHPGVLLTNGTGTGKTFSGLGAIKRMLDNGKQHILVVAPSDKIGSDWVAAAKEFFGITDAAQLPDTKSNGAGSRVVVTTYANLGQNNSLVQRPWDAVVTDEAHYLSSSKNGNRTEALDALRALTLHRDGKYRRADMENPDAVQRLSELREIERKFRTLNDEHQREKTALTKRLEAARDAIQARMDATPRAARQKVIMLSATPFAYHFSLDYAEGYLFDYPPENTRTVGRYNHASPRSQFYMENLGYRMRTGNLTQPENATATGILERRLAEKLMREGAMSGRALQVDQDYGRHFVLTESELGTRIDEIVSAIQKNDFLRPLAEFISIGDFLERRYLLEALKAREAVSRINKHLAIGRKVVVFHDYKKGGATNPLRAEFPQGMEVSAYVNGRPQQVKLADALDELKRLVPHYDNTLARLNGLLSPIDLLSREFRDIAIFNGDVPTKKRREIVAAFNASGSGSNIVLVQRASGKEGISLHDRDGKHQRVLIDLGIPGRPTDAIQSEGRIYRFGVQSNAVIEYLTTGTSFERWTFAQTIAQRASTAENLAMGERARALLQSFATGYMEAEPMEPSRSQGTGGKQKDAATQNADPFKDAVALYYTNAKKTSRNKSAEGIDYFPTSEPLGFKMVEWAGIRPGEKVLEPSAGHGAIARFFPDSTNRHAVEPSNELAGRLALNATDVQIHQTPFEDYHITNKFDVIVMNPPFGTAGKTAMDHVIKAAQHLRNGGRIVALIPEGSSMEKRFDKWMDSEEASGIYQVAEYGLPNVAFERAGTGVKARVVILDKTDAPDRIGGTSRGRRDFSGDTVEQFFESIKNATAPDRAEVATLEKPEQAAEAEPVPMMRETVFPMPSIVQPNTFVPADAWHAKKGKPVYVAKIARRLERDAYEAAKKITQKHSGYYSAFKGSGAIPGFQFETAEDRDAFLAEALRGSQPEGLASAPSSMPLNRAAAIVRNLDKVQAVRALNPREQADYDEAQATLEQQALYSAPNQANGRGMASDTGAAQNTEPSPGGLSEARQKAFDDLRSARRDAEDNLADDVAELRRNITVMESDDAPPSNVKKRHFVFYRGHGSRLEYEPNFGFIIDELPNGKFRATNDVHTGEHHDWSSFREAVDDAQQEIINDWEGQQVDRGWGQWERGKEEAFTILNSFVPPPGIESIRTDDRGFVGSGGMDASGSIYGHFRPTGSENGPIWKIRIADHDNQSVKHELANKQFVVPKHWSPQSVESALRDAYEWLAKKVKNRTSQAAALNAPEAQSPADAMKKSGLETPPQTPPSVNPEFSGAEDRALSSAPAPDKSAEVKKVLESMPPIWRDVLKDTWDGLKIEAIAQDRHLSVTAVGNILRMANGRFRVLMDAQNKTLKPSVRVEGNAVKADAGRPDLAGSGNAAFAAVDQRRARPEEVTHQEMNDLAESLFAADPVAAEKLVVRWMDSGTTVLSTDGMPDSIKAIVNEAGARQAAEMLMTAAAKLLVTDKSLNGGDSLQIARLIDLYRNTGTEQARALNMRQDPHATPEERAAMYVSEALLTPPQSMRNQIRRNPANKERILAQWAQKADRIKQDLKAAGYDIDATFRSLKREKELAAKTVPTELHMPLARASGKTRKLVRAVLEGKSWREAAEAAGMSLDSARKAYNAFREAINKTGQKAAEAQRDALLRSAPIQNDFAAAIGLPEWTEDADVTASPIKTPATEELKRERKRTRKSGEFSLQNPVAVARVLNETSSRKSGMFDKLSEFWRASILSGPQTHVVNAASSTLYGAYEATLKKAGTAVMGDIARLFGMKADVASLADMPAMLSATLPAIREGWNHALRSWRAEARLFDAYARGDQFGDGKFKEEAFEPALGGVTGKIMRSISFRAMTAADEFIKSFFTRIEAAAQARQIARNEGLTGKAMADRIAELNTPGSEAWIRALDHAHEVTFQKPIGEGHRVIDQLDGLAKIIERAKSGDFGALPKGLSHFVFPFVATPLNIFKSGLTLSPMGSLFAVIDAARAYDQKRKGNTEEAARIYNAARALDDLANQIVAWGSLYALSSLVKPGDGDDDPPYLTGSMEWRATSKGERELAYRTAPPLSVRIGGQWYSYKRLDPFASALAFVVDSIKAFQKGHPMEEAWAEVGVRVLANMQDKTFLQGISDLMNAIHDPGRYGTRWATNIATGFVPNLIRQPIRSADPYIRESDLPNDMGFFDALAHRVGYGIVPQVAMPKVDVWGRPAKKDTGTGGPVTDTLLRLFSPVDTKDAGNADPLDVALLRYNLTHDDNQFAMTAPRREIQRTRNGTTVRFSLNDEEYNELAAMSGQAARRALGASYDRELTESDVKKIKSVIESYHELFVERAYRRKLGEMQSRN